MDLPAHDERSEPVGVEVQAELGGEEGGEDEVENVEDGGPPRFVQRVTYLGFDHVDAEVLQHK